MVHSLIIYWGWVTVQNVSWTYAGARMRTALWLLLSRRLRGRRRRCGWAAGADHMHHLSLRYSLALSRFLPNLQFNVALWPRRSWLAGDEEEEEEEGSSDWKELGIKLHRMSLYAFKYRGRKYQHLSVCVRAVIVFQVARRFSSSAELTPSLSWRLCFCDN